MRVPLAFSASKRVTGRFPEVALINLVAEKTETQVEAPYALICRPGLVALQQLGTHPIRAMAQKEGLFSGDLIIPAGQAVNRMSTEGLSSAFTGALPGYNRVRVAIGRNHADEDAARIATGDGLYLVTGTTVAVEDFPEAGGSGASDIEYFKGFWLASQAGTDLVYYLIPGEATWTGLDFASAEYQPDLIVAIRARGDQIWMLGRVTTEAFYLTGDASAVIAPSPGMAFDFGCLARDTAILVGSEDVSAVMWVDNKGSVRLTKGDAPIAVSDPGLTEEIRAINPADLRASSFAIDGHFYYCLTLGDSGTAVYDLSGKRWSRFSSVGYGYWRAHIICDTGQAVLAADALTNQIWTVTPDALDDDGEVIATVCTAYRELKEGREPCWDLTLDMSVGFADLGIVPLISMRLCRDSQVYGEPRFVQMPTTGAFGFAPRWNRNGEIRAPHGLWMQFACSDATVKRYSGVNMNVVNR